MPKKTGTNSKALEARERKQAVKKTNLEKAAKDAEDRLWQDDDKTLAKKKAKKEEEERKKAEIARKKAETKELLEQEVASIKVQGKPSVQKITRQQMQDEMEKRNKAIEQTHTAKAPQKVIVVAEDAPLEQNLNRIMANTDIATNIDEAIAVLNVNDTDDKHPEKRMKAAFKTFEENNLPRIKNEYPSLRLSQWKQMLMKEWNKSPENPFNQRF